MAAERPDIAQDRQGATHDGLGALRGRSPAMQRLYRGIERVAATDTSVLIVGPGIRPL